MNARLVLAFVLVSGAAAQTPDPCATAPQTCATLINTQATSRARIPNTAADITVAITGSRPDLPTVQRDLTTKAATLLAYLRDQHAERLMTVELTFTPDTRDQKNGPQKTVGYDGRMRISFRLPAEKAPEVLAGVLTYGANNVESTTFTATELEIAAIRRQLSAEATQTAVAQAEVVAKAAGLHVSAIRSIDISSPGNTEPYRSAPAPMMFKAAAPLAEIATAAGDNEYTLVASIQAAAVR